MKGDFITNLTSEYLARKKSVIFPLFLDKNDKEYKL